MKEATKLDDHFTPPTLKLWLCSRCQAPRLYGSFAGCYACGSAGLHDTTEYVRIDLASARFVAFDALLSAAKEARTWLDETIDNTAINAVIKRLDTAISGREEQRHVKGETMKSNAEIAREIVGSWNGVLDYPPVSDTDKRDMQSTIERVLTTAQSDLARQVLAETQRSRSVSEVSGRLHSLFAQLGIEIGESE